MKVSEFIVKYFAQIGVKDVFGYPGGMVIHLMNSFASSNIVEPHISYHEQGASFCGCGYAQINGIGAVFATSGPGATNLVTGICNAYFDSIPVIFITGQVNVNESKINHFELNGEPDLYVRQKGFQEIDVVSMLQGVTKYATYINEPQNIKYELDKALYFAQNGRPGPVLLDIPMNIQSSEIDECKMKSFTPENPAKYDEAKMHDAALQIQRLLDGAERPVIVAGNGINIAGARDVFRLFAERINIPIVTSMISVDLLPSSFEMNMGFLGTYGHRSANVLIANSDLLLVLGSRLDTRQTGVNTELFAPEAQIIRVDIDQGELNNKVKHNEISFNVDVKELLQQLNILKFIEHGKWKQAARKIKNILKDIDATSQNNIVCALSNYVPNCSVVTTDVGQNQVWVAQSFLIQGEQRILFSGGHGAMGYSLPSSIGAYYATKRPVFCFCGDGGLQMNIQELQMIATERLPIKVILLNNNSLGMIKSFQDQYFDSRYVLTNAQSGYTTPNFLNIASAYGLRTLQINNNDIPDCCREMFLDDMPLFVEVVMSDVTSVQPKALFNVSLAQQEPSLPEKIRKILNQIIYE